jgi:hypothetical protein
MKGRRDCDPTEYVVDLSRAAMRIPLEDVQTLLYDLEHTAPMSVECALVRVFLAWRKQLEQLPGASDGNRD